MVCYLPTHTLTAVIDVIPKVGSRIARLSCCIAHRRPSIRNGFGSSPACFGSEVTERTGRSIHRSNAVATNVTPDFA
jgi:hypothetical protein